MEVFQDVKLEYEWRGMILFRNTGTCCLQSITCCVLQDTLCTGLPHVPVCRICCRAHISVTELILVEALCKLLPPFGLIKSKLRKSLVLYTYGAPVMATALLTVFPRLPVEIRLQIWHLALVPEPPGLILFCLKKKGAGCPGASARPTLTLTQLTTT